MLDNENKKERKYFDILRGLIKSDSSIIKKLKVTVSKGEFNEGTQYILIGPSMLINSHEYLINQNSSKISSENIIENSNEQIKNINKNESHILDYPDSSDLSDNE